jgi:hypothetical protein
MAASELRADDHSIEPIPDRDRDSTGPQRIGLRPKNLGATTRKWGM